MRGADSTETYEVTIEQGSEVQKVRVGLGQVDASVPLSQWTEVDAPAKTIRPADVLDVNAKPLDAEVVVKIGDRVTFAPSTITGFEASFTRNYSPYDVPLDGKIVRGEAAFRALYEALREAQSKDKKRG